MHERLFTPEEANRTLPLVRKIVADILEIGKKLRSMNGPKSLTESEKEIAKLKALFDELEQIGCYFKDWNFAMGLVDFPSEINGQKVLLCWRSDEPAVAYYHGYDEGYAGRRAIPSPQ